MDQQRIFISAVSGEFKSARDALGHTLTGLAITVREQSNFSADPRDPTLLGKLHNYIQDCGCVVSLIGTRSGSCPPPAASSRFQDQLPGGIDKATHADWSYTQWEVFFALHYQRNIVFIRAADDYAPDTAGPPDDQQTKFIGFLRSQGTDLTVQSSNNDHIRAEVMRALWPNRPAFKPIHLPFPTIGDLFTGRDDFLRDLRTSLLRPNGGASAIVSSVHGMGGIGKTRTAVEYAHRHQDDYTALLFVRAPDEPTLTTELAALTSVLRLPETTETEQNRDSVLRWLTDHHGWLLILDNVDTPDAVQAADEIVRTLTGGHVLLTSRLDDAFRHGIQPLELALLPLEDAVTYLLKATAPRRRSEPDDTTQARVLAEALDRLTLALVHAGAYIAEQRISFARYLTEWNLRRDKVLTWARPEKTGYPLSLAQTWLTSMDQLTEAGKFLLERLSFFASEPVPVSLLDTPIHGSATPQGLDPLVDLARYSLVTRDPAAETFTVHRIVSDVSNRRLNTDSIAYTTRLTEALDWMDAAFTGDAQDVRTWPTLNPLAPHAEAVAEYADTAGIVEPTVDVISRLARLFRAQALHRRAEPHYRRALAIAEAYFPPTDPRIATHLNNLAVLLQNTDQLGEAEPLMRRALAIDEAHYGQDHPSVAIRLNNLAQLLQATNCLGEAEPMMRRALAIDEAHYGQDHPSVAIRLNNLAGLLRITNRLGEAEPLMRRALAIDEAGYGQDHPNVATSLNNLAGLLRATNRLGEAEPLYRRALAIDKASYGQDHPDVAIDLNNLAALLQATNRLGEAEPLMRRHLVIFLMFQRDTGHAHPHRDAAIRNYSGLLSKMGHDEASIRTAIEDAVRESGLG